MGEKSLTERFAEILNAAGYTIDCEKLKELVEVLEKAFADIGLMAQAAINALSAVWDEATDFIVETEPSARRRKRERDRARAIEQRYRAEIKRFERERFCRRIFKPP